MQSSCIRLFLHYVILLYGLATIPFSHTLLNNLALYFYVHLEKFLILIFGACGTKLDILDNLEYRWTIGVKYKFAVKGRILGLSQTRSRGNRFSLSFV